MVILGLATAVCPNITSFIVLRFFLGAIREVSLVKWRNAWRSSKGAGLTGIVMACELFPATERTYAGTALELFWATSWMLLAGWKRWLRHRRVVSMFASYSKCILRNMLSNHSLAVPNTDRHVDPSFNESTYTLVSANKQSFAGESQSFYDVKTRFLPESIPWLAANGREDEADVIIRRAAKADGIHFDEGPILSRWKLSVAFFCN